ncbi:MAG TPA: hypothetical protein VFK80_08770, partial [Limnochordia bacterium]|nr:hypothetical protein [Limnochordia bacterium]
MVVLPCCVWGPENRVGSGRGQDSAPANLILVGPKADLKADSKSDPKDHSKRSGGDLKLRKRRAFIAGIMALATASAGLSPAGVAAAPQETGAPTPAEQLESAYLQGVRNAAIARPDEISDSLLAISDGNPELIWNADHTKLLVVTWKSQSSYERFIKPATKTSSDPANVIWVSAAPQVQRFCEDYLRSHPQATQAELELRLKQYLGLDPNW